MMMYNAVMYLGLVFQHNDCRNYFDSYSSLLHVCGVSAEGNDFSFV